MGRFMRPGGPIRKLTLRERIECEVDVLVYFALVAIGFLAALAVMRLAFRIFLI